MVKFENAFRDTPEVVDLLMEEAGSTCRAIELGDGYLAAVINPCLGPDEDRVARLLLAAPEMLVLLEAATSDGLPQDFRNRAHAIVSSVRGDSGREPNGAQELGSQGSHARD